MSKEIKHEMLNDVNSVEKAEEQVTQPTPQPEQGTLSQLMGDSRFTAFNTTSNSRGSSIPAISIVCTPRHGKRLSVSNTLFNQLGKPTELAIAYNDTQLALGSELPMDAQKYPFSPDEHSHIIYRSALVLEIVRHFGLKFGEGKGSTSKLFSNIRMDSFTNSDGVSVPVAFVSMT
jgi:hypothetical protein